MKKHSTITRGRRILVAAAALALGPWLPVLTAHAQADYPNRAIKIVVPFTPGGPTDASTRLIAQEMQNTLGQPVIVDNKAGAAGALGIDFVAKAAPDGYTLGISGVGPTILLSILDPKLPYKPLTDLSFIGGTAVSELVFVVNKDVPANNLQDLLKLARERALQRKPLTYASTGQGGPIHVSFEYLKMLAKVDMVHVPYKGDAQQVQDLVGGQVDVGLLSSTVAASHIKSGRIKAIAAAGAKRSALMPDLPTVAESGLPGYQSDVFLLLVAPAGTPPGVIGKLNAALNAALARTALQERYLTLGLAPLPLSLAQTREFLQTETKRWAEVIHQAKVTRDN